MKKYMILGHENPEIKPNPDSMKLWMAWKEEIGDALIDFGAPLLSGKMLKDKTLVSCEKKLAGYMIMQGENLESILDLLSKSPLNDYPEKYSVYEIMAF